MRWKFFATICVGLLAVTGFAQAADYVLVAGNWGKKQDRAVAEAGGTVVWSHGRSGIAQVSSDAPGFLEAAMASRAFQQGAPDMTVQWQEPLVAPQAITPGDEPFFPFQWNMQTLEAPAAWAAGCTGAGVRVAINDGGIWDAHPDLEPNLDKVCSVSFVPGEPYNTDTGTFWHGTHVAGIVAAADNGGGVIGVAPEATLVGVKVLHNGSGTFGQVIGGILYGADPAAFGKPECAPADIINMSLGAGFNKRLSGGGPLVAAMAKANNFAASKGTLVISAAGNDGLDLGQSQDVTFVPAESGSGLAISATGPTRFADGSTNFRRPAHYSNYGEGTTYVAAPGGDFVAFALVEVNSPADLAGTMFARPAAYGPLAAGETGEVALWNDASDTTGDPHDACEGAVDPGVAGKIALIHRGACTFSLKSKWAQLSGAIGVIISNNSPIGQPPMGGTEEIPMTIPSVGIFQADGAAIEAALPGVNVTLQNNPSGLFDMVLSTCRSGWCFAAGTSMASPAASGVAALIKASNPGISLGALKARLAQTADDEGRIGNDEFYGHGFVNAYRACTE